MAECVHYFEHCFDILRRERDPRRWPALIDAIPDEAAREPVRRWLDEERKRWCGVPGRSRKRGV